MPSLFTKIKKKFSKSSKDKVEPKKSAEITITQNAQETKKKGLFFKSSNSKNKKVVSTVKNRNEISPTAIDPIVTNVEIEEKENQNIIKTRSRSKSPNSTCSPPLFEGFNNNENIYANNRRDQRQLGSLMDLDSSFDEESTSNNGTLVVQSQYEFQPYRNYNLDTSGALYTKTNHGLPSPTESSDFCLSTDVEDDEYNKIRHNPNALPDAPLSPNSTQSSEAYGLFPNLIKPDMPTITPMAHETEDDLRAWTPSPRHANTPNLFSFDKQLKKVDSDTDTYVAPLVGESLLATSIESNDSDDKLCFTGVALADGLSPNSTERESLCSPKQDFFDPAWSTQDFKFQSFSPKKEVIPQHPRSTKHRSTNSAPIILTDKDKIKRKKRRKGHTKSSSSLNEDDTDQSLETQDWLIDEVTGALGPRGITADLESLGGRSNKSKTSTGGKSHRSTKSHRSAKSHKSTNSRRSRRHTRQHPSGESVGSKNSHISHRSSRSTRSHLSHMSEASRSVANDLLRLEMQLAMVGSDKNNASNNSLAGNSRGSLLGSYSGAHSVGNASRSSRKSRSTIDSTSQRRSKITIVAPPGKLGIILANKFDTKGTVISGVRSSSVLVDKLHPGDRITAVDGEDVSRMTVAEITTIMARKNDFERTLTILTTPKTNVATSPTNMNSIQNTEQQPNKQ